MAFLGHIDCQGTMVSRELFCSNQPHQDDIEIIEGSRTYIKTYDQEGLLQAMGSPSTVRYVGDSGSSSEVNSLDETESSILRRSLLDSQHTLLAEHDEYADDLDTASETICLQLGSLGSASSSASSSRSNSSRESDDKEKSSTTSMCSWEEAMSRGENMLPSQRETRNFSLPTLHLESERGSAPMTYTRRLDPQRLERPADDAFENWLSAKRQQAKYRRQVEQKTREAQLQRAELRQRQSQERYEQWCRRKMQTQSLAVSTKPALSARIPPPSKPNAATTKSRLHQWELEKLRLAEQRRQQLRSAERRRQQEDLQRQQQADYAFQRWMSQVGQRPKPVPSGQGIQSLRGTISNLYINPNRWVD
ncbi:hypothetical protein KR032_001974 [Drosophila birchii]|nr:hypothetical protein KR032_001974 [Drosophila birchii]